MARRALAKKSALALVTSLALLTFAAIMFAPTAPCPSGTFLVGAPPPMNTVQYCATFDEQGAEKTPIRNGVYVEWYRDRGSWQDGQKVPTRRIEGVYKNDFENGTFKKWDFKGRLQYEKDYREGVLEGPYALYQEGVLTARGHHHLGLKHGPYEERTPSQALLVSGAYHMGKRDGEWSYYWSDGTLRKRHQYKKGADHGETSEWFPSGALSALSFYEDGYPTGQWLAFRRDGSIKSSRNFLKGAAMGAWRLYADNGQLISEKLYATGVLEGRFRLWHEDGAKRLEGFYIAGEKYGIWSYYDRAGDLVRSIEHIN